jgi:hypothetical protein
MELNSFEGFVVNSEGVLVIQIPQQPDQPTLVPREPSVNPKVCFSCSTFPMASFPSLACIYHPLCHLSSSWHYETSSSQWEKEKLLVLCWDSFTSRLRAFALWSSFARVHTMAWLSLGQVIWGCELVTLEIWQLLDSLGDCGGLGELLVIVGKLVYMA